MDAFSVDTDINTSVRAATAATTLVVISAITVGVIVDDTVLLARLVSLTVAFQAASAAALRRRCGSITREKGVARCDADSTSVRGDTDTTAATTVAAVISHVARIAIGRAGSLHSQELLEWMQLFGLS